MTDGEQKNLMDFSEKKEDPKNVQYYDHVEKELKQTQRHKADKFIEHDCIHYVGENCFECRPIKGYNTRTYSLQKLPDGTFSCNCQWFRRQTKLGEPDPFCSHIYALMLHFRGRKKDELDS